MLWNVNWQLVDTECLKNKVSKTQWKWKNLVISHLILKDAVVILIYVL